MKFLCTIIGAIFTGKFLQHRMSEQYLYAFVHGFLNDKNCPTGNKLKTGLKPHGIDLDIIDAMGGFTRSDCTISSGVAALEALYKKHKQPLRLLASSMGGFIAANYTQQYPQNVDRLVLLNPAFNLESNWLKILAVANSDDSGEALMKKWKEEGQLMLQGRLMTEPEPISYNYVVDSLSYPAYPLVDMPVLIFSSVHDILIPAVTHQEWKKRQKEPEKINIVDLEENHSIQSETSWEIVISTIMKHFE